MFGSPTCARRSPGCICPRAAVSDDTAAETVLIQSCTMRLIPLAPAERGQGRSRREGRHGHRHSSEGSAAGDHRSARRHLHRVQPDQPPRPQAAAQPRGRSSRSSPTCCDILYPGYGRRQNLHIGNVEYHVGDLIDGLHDKLTQQIARALRHEHDCRPRDAATIDFEALAQQKTIELLQRLPDIAHGAGAGRAGRLRGRPGRQEPSRDHLLLSRPGGDHRSTASPTSCCCWACRSSRA